MAIGLIAATLVSIFVECILYGLLVFLFIVSTVILVRRGRDQKSGLNVPLLVVSVTMVFLSTIHISADLRRLLEAFLLHGTSPQDIFDYLSEVNTAVYGVRSTAYCAQTLVGDGFALYRLYVVWQRNKLVVLPFFIVFVASIGVGIGTLRGFAIASPNSPIFTSELGHWIISFFALTLFVNISATTLFAGRIWHVHRKVRGTTVSGKTLLPAAVIIIESGAIYSFCLVLLLALYLTGSNVQFIILDAVSTDLLLQAIVFSLVIVRVALGVSTNG
ncbi:hypothetical protein BDZ97DRAFT_1728649, partial [Flammula alnicola]